MGESTYRTTPSSLSFDAFYSDEFGRINDDTNTFGNLDARKGFHKNRFTNVFEINGQKTESSNFTKIYFANQANPNENSNLTIKQHGCPPKGQDTKSATIYFSNSVLNYWQHILIEKKKWDSPINLTILFAVGTELNRHGLRNFFESQTNMQGIIVVSGVEVPRDNPVRIGVSPSTAILKTELNRIFGIEVEFKVKVIAAFSTGYCGLNICIQNELLNLAEVERLVFYDCLYLSGADCSTAVAVQKLKSKVDGSKFKLIAYKCTQAANSFADDAKVNLHPQLVALFSSNRNGLVENLYYNPSYTYLITYRILSAAFDDQVISFPNDTFKRAFDELKIVIPKRGYIISNLDAFKYAFGANADTSKLTVFNDWAQVNRDKLRAFGKFLGTKNDTESIRGLIWKNALPGWGGGDGEENHDLLIPEFGWEYLPY
jgi:hypothetical protein